MASSLISQSVITNSEELKIHQVPAKRQFCPIHTSDKRRMRVVDLAAGINKNDSILVVLFSVVLFLFQSDKRSYWAFQVFDQ